MSSYEEGWFREDELREAAKIREWEDAEHQADLEMEARERFTERDYRTRKEQLEERMGLEGSHLSPQRLRLLDEYNRDEERTD